MGEEVCVYCVQIKMKEIDKLFFELIRVAIGTQDCLSHTPTADEWGKLYKAAKKQSLVGVCFAALQKLGADADDPSLRQTQGKLGSGQEDTFARIGMSEDLYFDWMGMAATIQQRNEVVTRQCAELQAKLSTDGYKSAILKGQDYARYYKAEDVVNDLHLLRQSGDIDLWVDGNRDDVIRYVRGLGVEVGHVDIKHSDMHFFEDTEVEVHFQPSWMYCPKTSKRLMEWFQTLKFEEFEKVMVRLCSPTEKGMVVPPLEFSLVYCMVHIYRHFFSEGIGLRQVLDMYFLLLHSSKEQREEAMRVMDGLHMRKAVSGITYLLLECFGMDSSMLFCKADEKLGRFLLSEMMTTGNFGHDDTRYKHLEKSHRWQRGFIGLKHNWKYLLYFPEEVLWSPFWKLWHYCWRKRRGYL